MKGVSFLIVNFYTSSYVRDLVSSLLHNIRRHDFEILICDNSCDQGEKETLLRLQSSRVKTIFPAQNLGFVKANNELLMLASLDLLVLLNPDTRLIDSSLENLIEYYCSQEDIGAMGPRLLNEDGSEQVGYYRFPFLGGLIREHLLGQRAHPYAYAEPATSPIECDVIKGTCFVILRSLAKEVGLFDDEFVMYSEEVDLCKRLNAKGRKNIFFPDACVVHYGEKSARRKESNTYSLYHYHRSRLIYFRKHHSLFYYVIIRGIIAISLLEKSVGLSLVRKTRSAHDHFQVLRKIGFRSLSRLPLV